MDLEREDSAHESVADNEAVGNNGNSDSSGDVVSNGSVFVDRVKGLLDEDRFGEGDRDKGVANLSSVMGAESSGLDSPVSPGTVKKGRGLRKWRRIKREVTKEGYVVVDGSKLSKRGFSSGGAQGKSMQFSNEMRQRSEGSVSSTHGMVWRLGGSMDEFGVDDMGPAAGPFFATAAESENSDDRSSKSSTAASVPKMRYGANVASGQVKDRNKIANVNNKNLGSTVQKVSQGKKVQSESSKKARGEQVNIEKETSHSSMESDSRSSNFIFMQDNRYVTGNGRQNGGSMNYDAENSPETLANSQQATEQLRSGSGKNSDGESEDVSQEDLNPGSSWSVKEGNSENQGFSTDQDDPTIEAMHMLQSAQEAFEKEIQKIMEIGKEYSVVDDSNQDSCLPSELTSDGLEANGSDGDNSPRSLHDLESEVSSLRGNVHLMETKLEETTAMLKMKEAKIVELEDGLGSHRSQNEMGKVHDVDHLELQSELEALYKQKIEAEVEFLTISKTIQDLRVASVDQISQLEEKVESKAVNLKRDAEKLEQHCEDVVIADETVKLKSSVCKYSTCFLIQLISLVVMLLVIISQFSPHSAGVVPT